MAKKNVITIEGDKEFHNILDLLPQKFEDKIKRDIARKGGRVVLKTARKILNIPGQLGKDFASEMIVGNDKQNKAGVVVTVRGGRSSKMKTNSAGEQYIPGAVGRHMTEGAKQSARKNKSGANRGKVTKRYADPIEQAADREKENAMLVMQKEAANIIDKHIRKHGKNVKEGK